LKTYSIKNKLKNISWISSLNAWWKTRKAKKLYTKTLQYYCHKPPEYPFDVLLLKHLKESAPRLRKRHSALNIFYLGTDELQDRGGILQALEKFGNLHWFTQLDGAYGHYIKGKPRDRRSANASRLFELFLKLHREGKTPDVLIAQTFSSYIDGNVFTKIKKTFSTLIVNIGMDDRHQYWKGTYGLIPHIDLMLTAAPESVGWYLAERCPAIFFPEASDSQIFYPMPDLPKLYDVAFVGGRYGVREEIVNVLRDAGIEVTTFGEGWENGRIDVQAVPVFFAQSKIVLGIGTVGHSYDFYALKMRDFDGPMSGSLYITHDNSDLQLVYKVGKEIVTYRTIDECVEKIRYYLLNDEKRETIAMAGYTRAVQEHQWGQRFQEVFNLLELIPMNNSDQPLVNYTGECLK